MGRRTIPMKGHEECPLCQQCKTAKHVLQCKDQRAQDTWKMSRTKLGTCMEKHYTNPEISSAILTRLQSWHDYRPTAPPSLNCTFMPALITHKTMLQEIDRIVPPRMNAALKVVFIENRRTFFTGWNSPQGAKDVGLAILRASRNGNACRCPLPQHTS